MDLFVKKVVFNSGLQGKAVHVTGHDEEGSEFDGIFLVKESNFNHLVLLTSKGIEITFWDHEFDQEGEWQLELTVLEEPK